MYDLDRVYYRMNRTASSENILTKSLTTETRGVLQRKRDLGSVHMRGTFVKL